MRIFVEFLVEFFGCGVKIVEPLIVERFAYAGNAATRARNAKCDG